MCIESLDDLGGTEIGLEECVTYIWRRQKNVTMM